MTLIKKILVIACFFGLCVHVLDSTFVTPGFGERHGGAETTGSSGDARGGACTCVEAERSGEEVRLSHRRNLLHSGCHHWGC